jgi:hypothetical protein
MCTESELLGWLGSAGVVSVETGRSGLYCFFEGRRG